ncbi:hypothetical protein EMGBS15_02550 [Filimonas sp.]|nr:hypothetical protein EMGBS15_02550 [Filimonas sp.]
MKSAFKQSLKIFKCLAFLFSIVYWIYMPIDDYYFIKNYWSTHWKQYIETWSLYYMIFLLGFAFYYWLFASILILVYFKIFKRKSTF